MAGIVSFGAYVPLHRLGKGTAGWTAGERAVASFDEDSLTMATAAALDCVQGLDRRGVEGLYFASTSSPYQEKEAATTIATAADLREQLFTADFTGSLRAATQALKAALDGVKAGSAQRILVTAAELRVSQPRSDLEAALGDGAAALLVGKDGVIAEVEDALSISHEIYDVWRSPGDAYVRSWEDRFAMDEGYLQAVPQAVQQLLQRQHLSPRDINRAVVYAPDGRRLAEMCRRLGLDEKTQLAPSLFGAVGNTGSAQVFMALGAALEQAQPGERILVASYGNGADALLLRVTPAIKSLPPRRGIKGHLASKKLLEDYQKYLRWRGLLDVAPAARRPPLPVPSASAMYRELDQNLRLYGVKCRRCGTPQYPIQRVCAVCRTKDEFEPYRFSDKPATLFTYSMDYLGPTLDPPLVVGIIDFQGGGRMLCQMTDRDISEVKVGMPLEMSLRRLHTVEGIHNYYWKAIPVRGQ